MIHQAVDQRLIQNIPLHKLDAWQIGHVPAIGRGEIIEDNDALCADVGQRAGQIAANATGAACKQDYSAMIVVLKIERFGQDFLLVQPRMDLTLLW